MPEGKLCLLKGIYIVNIVNNRGIKHIFFNHFNETIMKQKILPLIRPHQIIVDTPIEHLNSLIM